MSHLIALNDPYTFTDHCVARLWTEYQKHPRLIVAIDIDDTCFDFHSKNRTYPRVIKLLLECEALGFYLVIFTARAPENIPHAVDYIKGLGLTVASVNTNPFPLPYGNNGKPYYNILLDDRAGLGQACETLSRLIAMIKRDKACATS